MKTGLVALLMTAIIGIALVTRHSGSASRPDQAPLAAGVLEPVIVPLSAPVEPRAAFQPRQLADSGQVSAATIFGSDDRIPVTGTTEAPWRSIALLLIEDRFGNLSQCTGSMLNYNVVLTAAHCLYDAGSYVDTVLVAPGATPDSAPFGVAFATSFTVPKGWAETKDRLYDFGLLFFTGSPFGNLTGPYLTVASVPDSYFNSLDVVIASAGYPGDKPAGSMWFTASFAFYVDATSIYTQMDAVPGQSGSPIYTLHTTRKELYVVGVFSAEGPFSNSAVRFSPAHLTALQSYCAPHSCSITTKVVSDAPTPAVTATSTTTPSPTPTKTPTPSPTPSLKRRSILPGVTRD